MAQDIVLMGATFHDVPAVELSKDGGGTALFTDISDSEAVVGDVRSGKKFYLPNGSAGLGSYIWTWIGEEAELMESYPTLEYALEDTLYASWTPSTTAKNIVASVNKSTFVADFTQYEYVMKWRFEFDAVFPAGTVLKAAPERICAEICQVIMKRPNSLANIAAENFNGNACITMFTAPITVYYKADGTRTYTFAASYGVYPSVATATFSNSTSNTPTVTVKSPAIAARCSTSYMSTDMASAIDQEHSIAKYNGELYRIKKGSLARMMYGDLCDIYVNGVGGDAA
jgi:hypothetical protein